MEHEFPYSTSHQLLLPSQLAGNLLFKSQVEAQQGEEHHLCSAVTLLPKDKLDTYSKYTCSQNMRPPALEAMVSRRGDKAEACGAWQQSGQINHCLLYSRREKNGAIQEQIHLSLWGFTRVSEKPHGQQSLSAGTQESSRISMETWCFIHRQELHCQGAIFTALCVSWLSRTGIYLKAGGLCSATFAKDQWGKTEARRQERLAIFITKWGFPEHERNNCLLNSQLSYFHTKCTDNTSRKHC